MLKKSFFTFLSAILIAAYLLPGIADASQSEPMEPVVVDAVELSNFIDTAGLTKSERLDLERHLKNPDGEVGTYAIGIGAVLGIIVTSLGLGGSLYAAGRYAARQTEVRLGLTAKSYKANKWYYRIGISAAFGPLVSQGFDDHFYGI